jgi:deoxycytidine triphosphate deaminase
MILGHSELKKLITSDNLIIGLSERDQKDPEGCVFDLQLSKIYELKGKAFLGIDERETPELIEVASYDPKKRSTFIFKPGLYYMVKTVEVVNMPSHIAAVVKPRTTTFRSGLYLRAGFINPGYNGTLDFAIKNEGLIPVEVELGARFAQIFFMEVKGKAVNTYRGQWQGGKSNTRGREKQI